jgi:succinate dehydrogenase / fumarate reductase, cytochrome b subunit
MLVSILHRATGTALAIGGGLIFTWWLVAAATGAKSYEVFYAWIVTATPGGGGAQVIVNLLARLVGIGLTWAFFQHAASGVRHFVMDAGAGYELKANKAGATATILFSLLATLLFWGWILWGKN